MITMYEWKEYNKELLNEDRMEFQEKEPMDI